MKKLESFKNSSPPKRRTSKLLKFKNEIFQLYNDGYQVQQIQDFLKMNNVETSIQNLYYFLKHQAKNFSIKTQKDVGEADQNPNSVEGLSINDLRKRFKK